MANPPTLYDRLGGYDAISAVVNDLLPWLMGDEMLGRFWKHRGNDGLERETLAIGSKFRKNPFGPVKRDKYNNYRQLF